MGAAKRAVRRAETRAQKNASLLRWTMFRRFARGRRSDTCRCSAEAGWHICSVCTALRHACSPALLPAVVPVRRRLKNRPDAQIDKAVKKPRSPHPASERSYQKNSNRINHTSTVQCSATVPRNELQANRQGAPVLQTHADDTDPQHKIAVLD